MLPHDGIYATTMASTQLAASTASDYVYDPTPVGATSIPLPQRIQYTDDDATKRWKATTAADILKRLDNRKVTEQDKLQALGYILGCQAQVSAATSQWLRHLDNLWQNPSGPNFDVIGYYDSAGAPINAAGLPGNPSILKPIDMVTPRAAADRRPADVAFANIRCSFVFRDVAPDYTNQSYSRHDFEFMVHLPQETHDTLNGNNVLTPVTTFWGVDDITTLNSDAFQAQILSRPPYQQWPLQLTPAAPPATRATTDNGASYSATKNDMLRVMLSHNEAAFLAFVIPHFTTEPYDQVSSILQTSTDSAGKSVTLPFAQYHQLMMSAAQPWSSFESLPIDLHGVTFHNTDDQLKDQLKLQGYTHHLNCQPLRTDHQFTLMRDLLQAGVRAERTIQLGDTNMAKFLERTENISTRLGPAPSLTSQSERKRKLFCDMTSKERVDFAAQLSDEDLRTIQAIRAANASSDEELRAIQSTRAANASSSTIIDISSSSDAGSTKNGVSSTSDAESDDAAVF